MREDLGRFCFLLWLSCGYVRFLARGCKIVQRVAFEVGAELSAVGLSSG